MKEYYCAQCDKSYKYNQTCRHRNSNVVDRADIKVKIHCKDCFYGELLDAPQLNITAFECRRYPAITVDQFGWGIYPRNADTHWCGEGVEDDQ